jgi:nucleoside-diphosphate-sugar epimerase
MAGHRSTRKPDHRPCQVAYLPLDGNAPSNPDNAYGLSKEAGENMLRYYTAVMGVQTVAIRFPVTIADEWASRFKRNIRHPQADLNADEVFSYLLCTDAGRLVAAILRADLPGYRCYFPSAEDMSITTPVRELVEKYYAGVTLRKPVEEMKTLVDVSGIEKQTGWRPVAAMGE